uniref:Ubiquitin carboxyl-terminal hydrolase n=1 Tax=Acrobeloides nanus TaxID=290746 RepID=A0A914EAC9_9BILA
MPKVFVKWGKEKFELEADPAEMPLLFKSQLFGLTGVPPERQKVMIKGKTLPDDSWNGISLSNGATIMMMGSSEAVPEKPVYDKKGADNDSANEEEQLVYPKGLKNLGNTCYMNATLQCLRVIPELEESLKSYSVQPATPAPSKLITASVKNLFHDLKVSQERDGDSVVPFIMVNVLHSTFPQFATRTEQGIFQQQDANECWTEVLRMLANEVDYKPPYAESSVKIAQFLQGQFAVSLTNLEDPEEPPTSTTEPFMQLSCFLTQEVKYLQSGIKSKLIEEIEKHSENLGRNARYEKKCLINRLPAYLSIQMVRFFYKERDNVNAKILKDVKFPITLDLFDMCTPELQSKLLPMREAFKDYEDKQIERMRQVKLGELEPQKPNAVFEYEPFSFSDDPGSNNSGFYELKAIVTHKGRSSNSGHYVAWVRLAENKWAMLDDDQVHPVLEEDVLKLSGGGDWHCAYVLLYGPKRLKKM